MFQSCGTGSSYRFFGSLTLKILIVGLAIRLVLAPFLTYPFDIEHWGVILQNTESGNGLFGLTGYFYTPVWGYFLGFLDLIINGLTSFDYGRQFVDLLGIEALSFRFQTATVTTPEFNVAMKLPLIIFDVIVGYLVHFMTYSETGDSKKSAVAFGLWFLSPIVIYMSSVQAQFDCMSALFILVCVLLLKSDHCFLAGAMFALASLIKFFPAFCIFILCIYVVRTHDGTKLKVQRFMLALLGAVSLVVVMFLPQLMDGTFMNAFSFVFGRATEFELGQALRTYSVVLVNLVAMVLFAKWAMKIDVDRLRDSFISLVLVTLSLSAMMSSGPQYAIVYFPLLAYYAVYREGSKALMVCMWIIGITSVLSALSNNSLSILSTSVEYYGVWGAESLLSCMRALELTIVGPYTLLNVICFVMETIQTVFMALVVMIVMSDLGFFDRISCVKNIVSSVKKKLGGLCLGQ